MKEIFSIKHVAIGKKVNINILAGKKYIGRNKSRQKVAKIIVGLRWKKMFFVPTCPIETKDEEISVGHLICSLWR